MPKPKVPVVQKCNPPLQVNHQQVQRQFLEGGPNLLLRKRKIFEADVDNDSPKKKKSSKFVISSASEDDDEDGDVFVLQTPHKKIKMRS